MVSVNKYQNWKSTPTIDEHSRVKHKVYKEYISAYIKTLMSNAKIPSIEFSIIDGFCGGGIYQETSGLGTCYGSPIIVMQAVQESRAAINVDRHTSPRNVKVNYFFTDNQSQAIKSLKNVIEIYGKDNPFFLVDKPNIHIKQTAFEQNLDKLILEINTKTKSQGKAIFLLDQYGYGKANVNSLVKILSKVKKSEIILTFNIESMYPYFSGNDAFRKALINLGIDDEVNWKDYERIKEVNNNKEIRAFIQSQISEAIKRKTGAKYMTLFFIKPQTNKEWGYWLIHLTNNYRAHDVMKTIHWNNATYFGHELSPGIFEFGYESGKDGYAYGSTLSFDFVFDFGQQSEKSCIEAIHEDFGHLVFKQDKIDVEKLFTNTVTFTPASEKQLHSAVRLLHEQKDIQVLKQDGKERQPSKKYHRTDIIVPSKQLRLI
ncbi:three-Cys-motif partner protein TcmP [Moraxella osloensis]|nr:three-Cys-motif partner protein TcmP [Moraxella osloensis]